MKQSIDYQLTIYYYYVDNFFKHHPQLAAWRQSNNAAPSFTDAEVITFALTQSYFGCATLHQT